MKTYPQAKSLLPNAKVAQRPL